MGKKKVVETEWSVADAISNGVSDIAGLQEELQEWLDNMPESLQQGSKADELQEAIDGLDEAQSYEPCDALSGTEDDGGNATLGALRFTITTSARKGKSRADRCNEATELLRMALDTVRDHLANNPEKEEDEDESSVDLDEVESSLDELEQLIDNAEGVTFPGMR